VSSPIIEEPSQQLSVESAASVPILMELPKAVSKTDDTRHKSLISSPSSKKKLLETLSHDKERSGDAPQKQQQGSLHMEKIKIDYEAKLKALKLKEAELDKRLSEIDSMIEKRVREAVLTDRVATIANIHAQSLSDGGQSFTPFPDSGSLIDTKGIKLLTRQLSNVGSSTGSPQPFRGVNGIDVRLANFQDSISDGAMPADENENDDMVRASEELRLGSASDFDNGTGKEGRKMGKVQQIHADIHDAELLAKPISKFPLRVKGKNILPTRRKILQPSIADSTESESYEGSNEAVILDPPLYFSKQYGTGKRYANSADSTTKPVSMIKIVAPLTPFMVSVGTSTDDQLPPIESSSSKFTVGDEVITGGSPKSSRNPFDRINSETLLSSHVNVVIPAAVTAPNNSNNSLASLSGDGVINVRDAGSNSSAARRNRKIQSRQQPQSPNSDLRTNSVFSELNDNLSARQNDIDMLPIVSNQADILITRTYRHIPPGKTLSEAISDSDNPLEVLYHQFAHILPPMFRTRLLNACIVEGRMTTHIPSSSAIHQTLNALLENIAVVSDNYENIIDMVESCEKTVAGLVAMIIASPTPLKFETVYPYLVNLHRMFGDLEGKKLPMDLALHEFRSIFDRLNAEGPKVIKNLMKESNEFSDCYKRFFSCQGKAVEVNQRLQACKGRCLKYNLLQPELFSRPVAETNQAQKSNQSSAQITNYFPSEMFNNNGSEQLEKLQNENKQLKEMVEALESDLQTAENEIVETQQELFDALQEKDRTPGALIFFALLHDPTYVESLQQLVLQIGQLKRFAIGVDHVDFVTIKKRIQVCTSITPTIDKLVDRYFTLYKKWSNQRLKFFSQRNLTGGSADANNCCALCQQPLAVNTTKVLAPITKPLSTKK